ncbi:MAG: signal peptidase I [Planctomycetes bacterium]|nr:signal peptidase I [Planctomycetota bacterium]
MAKKENGNSGGQDAEKLAKTPAQEVGELVVCLGVAVILALLIKFVLVEVFVIPSGSMEPYLNGRTDGGDRVLCTKVNYYWREPKRWEVFVFLFPYENAREIMPRDADIEDFRNQNFIKRCIGLPGETISIRRGDIFVVKNVNGEEKFERQVKPDKIQRDLWIPVYDEDFSDLYYKGEGKVKDFEVFWERSGKGDWKITPDHKLVVETESQSHMNYIQWVRYPAMKDTLRRRRGIVDRYVLRQPITFASPDGVHQFRKTISDQKIAARCPWTGEYVLEDSAVYYFRRSDLPMFDREDYDAIKQGETTRSVGYHYVSDLRVLSRVKLKTGTTLTFELEDDDQHRQAIFTGGKKGSVALAMNGKRIEPSKIAEVDLDESRWHDLEFYCVDGVARVFVDGTDKPVIEWNLSLPTPDSDAVVERSGVMVSVGKGRAEFDDLKIDRDIHYFSGIERGIRRARSRSGHYAMRFDRFTVGKDSYMALGDNSPSSNDSRSWGCVPEANRRGPALFIWWPLRRIHAIQIPD